MPRYFFDVQDGVCLRDQEGKELKNARAARVEAIRVAGTIIASGAVSPQSGENWCLEVTSEDGLVLFRIDFSVSEGSALVQTVNSDGRSL